MKTSPEKLPCLTTDEHGRDARATRNPSRLSSRLRVFARSSLFAAATLALTNGAFADEQPAAVKANDFLNSLGVCAHLTQGEDDSAKVAECITFAGFRGVRDDGSTDPKKIGNFIDVHKKTGAKFVPLPITGDIAKSLQEYETLVAEGALLAVEGPNEPNNFKVSYQGQKSSNKTSLPIAKFQRDLYAAVKADPKLAGIAVFHSSEAGGSQPDNCGLQFLIIPDGAKTLMPAGTKYADFANTHNYVCGHGLKGIEQDNIAWNAEDPVLNGTWDGLWVEYGHTLWGGGFDGYSKADLLKLPRVTTETGWCTKTSNGGSDTVITEDQQAKLFVNLYLDAIKRGWSYTFVYMLRDSNAQGAWGFFHNDYSPKPSATAMHNLTTILADKSTDFTSSSLKYAIANQPATVHDLLMQKSNGEFELAVWSERAKGSDDIVVKFGAKYPKVDVYDPIAGSAPVKTLNDADEVPLTMSDHAFVIEVVGKK